MMDLLPVNTTELERNLSHVLQDATVSLEADVFRGLKLDAPPDNWLDALINEYGLGELSPYIDDKRTLISEGIKFERIRGTPAALRMVLGWVGKDAQIFEPGPSKETTADIEKTDHKPWKHFAEYDLYLKDVPDEQDICLFVRATNLAQPVRSRLWRLVRGYDRGVMILDDQPLNDALLDDDSGIRPQPGQLPCAQTNRFPKLSFQITHAVWIFREETTIDMMVVISFGVNITSWHPAMPYLDDLPEPLEIDILISDASGALSTAIYFGQVWTDQSWRTCGSWRATNAIVVGKE